MSSPGNAGGSTIDTLVADPVKKRKRDNGAAPVTTHDHTALDNTAMSDGDAISNNNNNNSVSSQVLPLAGNATGQGAAKKSKQTRSRATTPQQSNNNSTSTGPQILPLAGNSTPRSGLPLPPYLYDPSVSKQPKSQIKYGPSANMSSTDQQRLYEMLYPGTQRKPIEKSVVRERVDHLAASHDVYVNDAIRAGRNFTPQEADAYQSGHNASNASINHIIASGTGQNSLNLKTIQAMNGMALTDKAWARLTARNSNQPTSNSTQPTNNAQPSSSRSDDNRMYDNDMVANITTISNDDTQADDRFLNNNTFSNNNTQADNTTIQTHNINNPIDPVSAMRNLSASTTGPPPSFDRQHYRLVAEQAAASGQLRMHAMQEKLQVMRGLAMQAAAPANVQGMSREIVKHLQSYKERRKDQPMTPEKRQDKRDDLLGHTMTAMNLAPPRPTKFEPNQKKRNNNNTEPSAQLHAYDEVMKIYDSPANTRVGDDKANLAVLTGVDVETDSQGRPTNRSSNLNTSVDIFGPTHDQQRTTRLLSTGQSLSSSTQVDDATQATLLAQGKAPTKARAASKKGNTRSEKKPGKKPVKKDSRLSTSGPSNS